LAESTQAAAATDLPKFEPSPEIEDAIKSIKELQALKPPDPKKKPDKIEAQVQTLGTFSAAAAGIIGRGIDDRAFRQRDKMNTWLEQIARNTKTETLEVV
jgi:hypothetical protein